MLNGDANFCANCSDWLGGFGFVFADCAQGPLCFGCAAQHILGLGEVGEREPASTQLS